MRRAVALCCALLPHGVEARVANEVDDKHSLEDAFGLMSGNSTFVQPKVLAAADDGGGDEVPDDWDPKPLTHDDWGLNDGSSSFDMRKHIFQGRGIFKGLSFDLTRQEHGGATGLNVAKNAIDDAKVHIQGEYSWGGRMVLVGSKPGKKPEALAAVQKVGMLSPMPNFVIFAQSDQVNYDDATDEFFAGGEDAPPKAHQPLHCATYHCGDKPAQVTCRSQDVEKAKKACEDGNQKFHNKPATLYPYAMMYEKKVSLVMRWHVQMITGWDDAGQPMHATDFYMPDYVVKPWSKKWTLGVATLSMGVYRGGAKKAYEDEVCNSYAKWFSGPSYQFTLSPGKKAVRKNTKQRMLDMPLMMMIQAVKTRVQNNRRQLKMLLAAIYLAPNVGALAANPAMLKTAAGAAKTELGKLGSMVKTHDFSGLMKEIGEKSAAGGEWILGDFQSKFQLSTWKNLFDQTKNGATAAVGSFKNLADKAAGKAKSAATSLFDKAKSLFGGGSAPTRSLTAPTPASTPSPTLSLTTAPPTLSAGMLMRQTIFSDPLLYFADRLLKLLACLLLLLVLWWHYLRFLKRLCDHEKDSRSRCFASRKALV
ncbi:unnamed protein product [Amoebophrya sp. A120]|nr:unnamed protein product [Amoebophrya sp. A120]|eukprot:GSA120T00002901001.1